MTGLAVEGKVEGEGLGQGGVEESRGKVSKGGERPGKGRGDNNWKQKTQRCPKRRRLQDEKKVARKKLPDPNPHPRSMKGE